MYAPRVVELLTMARDLGIPRTDAATTAAASLKWSTFGRLLCLNIRNLPRCFIRAIAAIDFPDAVMPNAATGMRLFHFLRGVAACWSFTFEPPVPITLQALSAIVENVTPTDAVDSKGNRLMRTFRDDWATQAATWDQHYKELCDRPCLAPFSNLRNMGQSSHCSYCQTTKTVHESWQGTSPLPQRTKQQQATAMTK